MMRSTTSGALFWLSFARASKRVTRIRMPTVPLAMRAAFFWSGLASGASITFWAWSAAS